MLGQYTFDVDQRVAPPLDEREVFSLSILEDRKSWSGRIGNDTEVRLILWAQDGTVHDVGAERGELEEERVCLRRRDVVRKRAERRGGRLVTATATTVGGVGPASLSVRVVGVHSEVD